MKILVVEDEKELLNSIRIFLTKEGFVCESCMTLSCAIEKVCIHDYDCLIIDINLPDGNGMEIIRKARDTKPEVGIIIISARDGLNDRIEGLETGADDYLTKPFHLSELNARLKSIIRRLNYKGNSSIVYGDLTIIPDERKVYVKAAPIELTKKEYDILLYFISNVERVLTKEAIAEHISGDFIGISDSFDFVYAHIKNLRKKITEHSDYDFIKTIYGIGYKFSEQSD